MYLYYEQYHAHDLFRESSILMRTADILHTDTGVKFIWANTSTEMLRPELDWERIGTRRVGNPFVFYSEDHEEYRLYYSASSVHLEDSNIDEPLHLGLARADTPGGPWTRLTDQPLKVDPGMEAQSFVTWWCKAFQVTLVNRPCWDLEVSSSSSRLHLLTAHTWLPSTTE